MNSAVDVHDSVKEDLDGGAEFDVVKFFTNRYNECMEPTVLSQPIARMASEIIFKFDDKSETWALSRRSDGSMHLVWVWLNELATEIHWCAPIDPDDAKETIRRAARTLQRSSLYLMPDDTLALLTTAAPMIARWVMPPGVTVVTFTKIGCGGIEVDVDLCWTKRGRGYCMLRYVSDDDEDDENKRTYVECMINRVDHVQYFAEKYALT